MNCWNADAAESWQIVRAAHAAGSVWENSGSVSRTQAVSPRISVLTTSVAALEKAKPLISIETVTPVTSSAQV
jgi:hypothetical protein